MRPFWTLGIGPDRVLGVLGVGAATQAGLMSAARELQEEWRSLLNQPGSGQVYPAGSGFITKGGQVVPITGGEGARSSSHVASAPGEPPAPETRELLKSIQVARVGDKVRVGSGLRKALALEYGVNVSGSRTGPHPGRNFVLQPRPHGRPAKVKAQRGMTRAMRLVAGAGVRVPRINSG